LIGLQAQEGISAQTECGVPVGGPPCADHSGSRLARELHRNRTDATRGTVDQDGLACREAAVVEQALPCGQPGDRQCGGHDVVEVRRKRARLRASTAAYSASGLLRVQSVGPNTRWPTVRPVVP